MTYLKINDTLYPAFFRGRVQDNDWGGRSSFAATLTMDYETASEIFEDDLAWSLVQQGEAVADADGNPVMPEPVETDYSEYCIAGPITDNRDGTVTVKMGKLLDAEALAIITGEV